MTEVSAQACYMTSDALAIGATLFEGPHRERMTKIVQPGAKLSRCRTQAHSTREREEHCDHGRVFHTSPGRRDEQRRICAAHLPSRHQVTLESDESAIVQRDKAIFLELGGTDHQAIRGQVFHCQSERL